MLAMKDLFDENSVTGWGLLLVDARNAFNSVSRVAALWNVRARVYGPDVPVSCSTVIEDMQSRWYVGQRNMYVLSREGVTQGNPLSMLMYTVAILPLIQVLASHSKQ